MHVIMIVLQLHLKCNLQTFQLKITFCHIDSGMLFFICTDVPNQSTFLVDLVWLI